MKQLLQKIENPNEVIGIGFLTVHLVLLFYGLLTLNIGFIWMIFLGLTMLGEVMFLSFWGSWTFNPWFKKKIQ